MTMRLIMLPAKDGDCLILRWGEDADARHIVVDLGRSSTWKFARRIFSALANVELLAITHVDADHVSGAVAMFNEKRAVFLPKDVWFNARHNLMKAARPPRSVEEFSPQQGEKITRGIARFKWPHNVAFTKSDAISTDGEPGNEWLQIGEGVRLLLLSPDTASLAAMLETWDESLAAAGIRSFDSDIEETVAPCGFEIFDSIPPDVETLAKVPYAPDTAPANCSSIAFLVEADGKRVLLAGDASSEVIERSLRPWAEAEGGRMRIDLVKLSHHGARSNTSPDFLKLVDCHRFAFSSDGSRGHEHPHLETVARILVNDRDRPKMLYFNYRGPHSTIWDNRALAKEWTYTAVYCARGREGMLEIAV